MLPQNRINLGLAFVPQTNNVFTGMTVEENLEMGGFLREDNINLTINDVYNPVSYTHLTLPTIYSV